MDQVSLGVVSKCYLGAPFEVHIRGFRVEILEHFETQRSTASVFEQAGSQAIHPTYALIEVYTGALHTVAADGSVSVIENEGD